MLNVAKTLCLGTLVALVTTTCTVDKAPESVVDSDQRDVGPLNATYTIDGSPITLSDGHSEMPAAPGSATNIALNVFSAPVYGKLDDDEEADAAVILVYEGGGSGTFYYLAAAIKSEDGYRGTNAVLLGDRLSPQFVRIQNRAIVAGYKDRAPSESFASTPTIDVTRYAILDNQTLIPVPAESEQSGLVSYGHEARAFFATKLVDVRPAGNCRDESISIEIPTPGAIIESPLLIEGRARGTWFFEGDFPIVLEDVEGNELSRSFVTAQGEWMTREFVPFRGTLSFTNSVKGLRGRLIFRKDNPTDRPELDDSMAIPVVIGAGSP